MFLIRPRYPWGDEAFEKARTENKLIFLSIGYSTSHWCHVMKRESFEDQDVATFMNEHYINIKVDSEERPDIDQMYINFIQVLIYLHYINFTYFYIFGLLIFC